MIFLLRGGPREGQLVDDLPSGYRLARAEERSMTILDGLVVEIAEWDGTAL